MIEHKLRETLREILQHIVMSPRARGTWSVDVTDSQVDHWFTVLREAERAALLRQEKESGDQ